MRKPGTCPSPVSSEISRRRFLSLSAFAIHSKDGLNYAFANGADFVCAGMYDFQVVEDANIALGVLSDQLNRERPWRA